MKLPKKLVAVFLTLTMLLSLTVVLATAKGKDSYKGKSLVVMGDSIAAGFGLRPGLEDTLYQGVLMAHGEFVENSWPQIVRDEMGFSQTTSVNLSRNMWRTDEFLRLLDPEYVAWLCEPENAMDAYMSDYMMFPSEVMSPGDTLRLASQVKGAIEQADVLVLALGSNDIMTAGIAKPIMLPLYQVFGRQAAVAVSVASEMRLRGLDTPEEWLKFALGDVSYTGIVDEVNKNTLRFCRNYEHLLDIIYDLNPDVKVYSFGITHPFQDMDFMPGVDEFFFQPLNEQVIVNVRNYMRNESRHRDTVKYIDMDGMKGYQFDYEVWPLFFYDFVLDVHPTAPDHAKIAQRVMNNL